MDNYEERMKHYIYIYIQGGPGVGLQLLHYLLHLNNYVLDVDYRK